MKTPSKLSNDKISRIVKSKFGMKIYNLSFVPEGEVSWIYHCKEYGNDNEWIIKIQRKKPSKAHSLFVETLVKAHYKWIPGHVLATNGKVWSRYRGKYFSIQEYINPGINSQVFKLDDRYLPELGEALHDLHNLTLPPSLRKGLPRQDYNPKWLKRLKIFLQKLKYSRAKKTRDLRRVVKLHNNDIQSLIDEFVEESQKLQQSRQARVLVHADIHPYNILRPEGDHLYIVDWDIMKLSDKEEDLMFFDNRQIKLISKGYGADLLENGEKIEYYRKYLLIRELAFFGHDLAIKGDNVQARQRGLENFDEAVGRLTKRIKNASVNT